MAVKVLEERAQEGQRESASVCVREREVVGRLYTEREQLKELNDTLAVKVLEERVRENERTRQRERDRERENLCV